MKFRQIITWIYMISLVYATPIPPKITISPNKDGSNHGVKSGNVLRLDCSSTKLTGIEQRTEAPATTQVCKENDPHTAPPPALKPAETELRAKIKELRVHILQLIWCNKYGPEYPSTPTEEDRKAIKSVGDEMRRLTTNVLLQEHRQVEFEKMSDLERLEAERIAMQEIRDHLGKYENLPLNLYPPTKDQIENVMKPFWDALGKDLGVEYELELL